MRRNVLLSCLIVLGLVASAHGQGSGITPLADKTVSGSAILIRASNGNRYALSCTNHSTTVAVRWGSSAVTAAAGQRIPAGATVELRTRGAVYMISEGASVTVSCTEELS